MDERDEGSAVRPFGSGDDYRIIRRRSIVIPDLDFTSSIDGPDQTEFLRTAQHNLFDNSGSEPEQNIIYEKAPSTSPREFRRARAAESARNEFRRYQIDDDETELRDKYAMFDDGCPLSPRLRIRKQRIVRLKKCFKSRTKDECSIEKDSCSFDAVTFVIFAFRFMSRNQRCLEHDKQAEQNHEIYMKVVKIMICNVLRWMRDQNLLQKPTRKFDLLPINCASAEETLTVLTTSSIDYTVPKYLQCFVGNFEEAIDLTSDYIHAHDKIVIQNDDDGMTVELNNLGFAELEIQKELLEIDTKHAEKYSEESETEQTPVDVQHKDRATATDAFYNAVAAMADDITDEDSSDSESSVSTFDVEDAKQTVLQIVNKIQNQMTEQSFGKEIHASPGVQQQIMKDLVTSTQHSEPERAFEIFIELQTAVSALDSYDFSEDDIEKCGSDDNVHQLSTPRTCNLSSQGTSKHSDASQGVKADEIQENSARHQNTIWKNLSVQRQDSGRRSPYLQFKKTDDESSVGTEENLNPESKYLAYEYIRESHENNNSIEVILKDNFVLSTMDDILEKATGKTDENTTLVTRETSAPLDITEKFVEDITLSVSHTIDNTEPETKKLELPRPQSKFANFYASRPMMDAQSPASPRCIADYWKTLLTYDFSPEFDEQIENATNDESRTMVLLAETAFEENMQENLSLGDSSDFSSLGSIPPAIQIPSSESEGLSEVTTTRRLRCEVKDYDPFHAARNTPLIVNAINMNLEKSLNMLTRKEYGTSIEHSDRQAGPSNSTDYADTYNFDTEDYYVLNERV